MAQTDYPGGVQQLIATIDDQLHCSRGISRENEMPDGLFDQIVFGKPGAGGSVQVGDTICGKLFEQLPFKEIIKKMMIPKPIPLVVQIDDKQVGVCQRLNKLFCIYFRFFIVSMVSCLMQMAAQGCTEAIQD